MYLIATKRKLYVKKVAFVISFKNTKSLGINLMKIK